MMTAFGPIKFQDKEGMPIKTSWIPWSCRLIKGQYEIIWPEKYASTKYVYPLPVNPDPVDRSVCWGNVERGWRGNGEGAKYVRYLFERR